MKAIIEFDLDEPREYSEWKKYTHTTDLELALWDITQLLRSSLKYEGILVDGYLTGNTYSIIEKLEDKVHDIIEDNDVKFIFEGN
jgi:hypothetical protein